MCNTYQVLEGGCSCLVGGVLKFSCAILTKSLKEAVAVWLVEFSSFHVQYLPSPSLKKAVADPTTWVQLIATRCGICVVYNNNIKTS